MASQHLVQTGLVCGRRSMSIPTEDACRCDRAGQCQKGMGLVSNQVSNLLISLEGVLAGAVAAGVAAAGVMWWLVRKAPQAAAGPGTSAGAGAPDPVSPSETALHVSARSSVAIAVRPTARAAAREDGDFVTSALVANATNTTTIGYLVGGSLTGALLGDALHPDKPGAVPVEDSSRRGSDAGWIDTGTSCTADSSSSTDAGTSGSGD